MVGTPDYIAPEVIGGQGYSETADWWSVGAILFEMMVGHPPFFSDDPSITCQKIMQWKKTLSIPEDAGLSMEACDLILSLMSDPETRLGKNGVSEICKHAFFRDFNWKEIRKKDSVFKPELKTKTDCTRFEHFDEEEPFYPPEDKFKRKARKDINFIGYTYKQHVEDQK